MKLMPSSMFEPQPPIASSKGSSIVDGLIFGLLIAAGVIGVLLRENVVQFLALVSNNSAAHLAIAYGLLYCACISLWLLYRARPTTSIKVVATLVSFIAVPVFSSGFTGRGSTGRELQGKIEGYFQEAGSTVDSVQVLNFFNGVPLFLAFWLACFAVFYVKKFDVPRFLSNSPLPWLLGLNALTWLTLSLIAIAFWG